MSLTGLTIKQVHDGLVKKEFSVVELTKAYLEKIKKVDKDINAYLAVTEDLALAQAEEVDKKIARGEELDILSGVPCSLKDVFMLEGVKCTAGSRILENYIAPYDATVVKKIKDRGAVILGKNNTDEFTMGSSGENSAFGPTKNPLDLSRVPGGSSSGPAAAVAADMAVFALGTDTGGSIRQPASFCGIVGLKPTYGAVSRYGEIAYASSLDQAGPLAKTAEDCQIVFEAIKGKDPADSTSVKSKVSDFGFRISDLRIGVPKEYFIKGIDTEVEKIIKNAIKRYEKMGAKIEEISLPHTKYALACYYIIATSEASANLARYDGIKYGASQKAENLLDVYLKSREEGLGPEARRRIVLGTYVLSAGYYEAYYLRAQKVRTLIRRDFEKAFEKVDAIFTPVSPTTAFKLGEKIDDPLTMYLSDIFTISINLAGLPALSLPVGSANGLPVGLQIIGRWFEENKILNIGKLYEQHT
ncbi:MAG: Asp-tRNA(Asn)/Glu-tRNA(Gln) amidotransferase subunit GatA [bacterium]